MNERLAENEFSASKQFMLTTGLQVDDIAWTVGRTQTVHYSSRYGNVKFENSALSYSFEVSYDGLAWEPVLTETTGIIMFNMPTSIITYGSNYNESIFPPNDSFLQNGASAPVTRVFVREKLTMADGDFIRVVAAPSIRMLSSAVGSGASQKNYFKFYLPSLNSGSNPHLSQSITLAGNDVVKTIRSGVNKVRINVTFPSASQGYDSAFFNFDSTSEPLDIPPGSVVEFYVGKVIVSLGLHI